MSVLAGRAVLITGGSIGIGYAVARACVEAGADVTICARGQNDLQKAAADLRTMTPSRARVLARQVDVSDPEQVSALMQWLETERFVPGGLVNAAGILGPAGALDEIDVDEWISVIRVNLIGTMLLCRAILPLFRKRRYGKIVNFSGGGATSPRPRFSAYAASKAAVVRLTENLAKEEQANNIFANAVAPGAVNTRMLAQVLSAGAEHVGETAYQEALKQKQTGGSPAERAAALCVKLLSAETDGITGRLISAAWDPWESLAGHQNELNESDIYTLRRIVPKDRGCHWD